MTNSLLTNLIGYWGLDEASGANNALDKHTGARTLTQVASPGSSTGKVYAGARTFNGSTQYFSRASETSLQGGDNDITFAAWVYLTSNSSEKAIVSKNDINQEYFLTYDSGYDRFSFMVNDGAGHATSVLANTFGSPALNTWHFVTAIHDAVNNQIKISVNNGTFDTESHTYGIASTSDNFCIGAYFSSPLVLSPLAGRIGPVMMWKSAPGSGGALTSTQVGQLYNSGNGLTYASFDHGDTKPFVINGYTSAVRSSNGTTLTCNVPPHVNGDTIYYLWASDGDADSASISGTGWTAVYTDITLASSGVADSGSFYMWKRTASSEPADYTVTSGVSERSAMLAFTVKNDGGINVSASNNSGTNSTAVVNSLTTTANDCLRISLVVATGEKTVATLSGHTLIATVSGTSAATISAQYKALPSSGTDGSVNATTGSNYWHTFAFAIASPAAGSHSLTANDITTGAPSVANAALTQNHLFGPTAITTSAPSVANATLNQNHVVTATAITTAAPSVESIVLGLGYGIPDLYTGAPSVATVALVQAHSLAATGITTSAPSVGTLSLISADSVVPLGIATGAPSVAVAGFNEFPYFVATALTGSAVGQTTVTLDVPAGTLNNDLLIAFFATENETAPITPDQSGWTLGFKGEFATRSHTNVLYWRRAGGSEPSTYTFSKSSGEWVGSLTNYRNAGDPYGGNYTWTDTTANGDVPSPNITTTGANHMVLVAGSMPYGNTFTPSSGFTERVDHRTGTGSANISIFLTEQLVVSATTLSSIVTVGANADYKVGGVIAFGPYVAVTSHSLTANAITTGNPTVDTATITYEHSLLSVDITTSQPTIGAATFSENQVLSASGITAGTPSFELPTVYTTLELVAIAPSIGPPTVDSLIVFQNHALVVPDITTGTPTLDNVTAQLNFIFTIANVSTGNPTVESATFQQVHAFLPTEITTGNVFADNVTFTQNNILVPVGIVTASPNIENATLAQVHVVTANAITTGYPVNGAPVISQVHNITLSPVTAGQPVVESLAINGATNITPVDFVTGAPTLGTLTLHQIHVIGLSGITLGAPQVEIVELNVKSIITANGITTSSPTNGTPTLAQHHALLINNINVGFPIVDFAPMILGRVLTLQNITTGQPEVGIGPIAQKHAITAQDVSTGAPLCGTPQVGVTHVLALSGVTTGHPSVDAATITPAVEIAAENITADYPEVGTPVLHQTNSLVAVGITTGVPVCGTLQIGIGNEIILENLITGTPVIDNVTLAIRHNITPNGITTQATNVQQIPLSQHHNLFANIIVTDEPTVGQLRLNPGERGLTPRTYVHAAQARVFGIRERLNVYTVRKHWRN